MQVFFHSNIENDLDFNNRDNARQYKKKSIPLIVPKADSQSEFLNPTDFNYFNQLGLIFLGIKNHLLIILYLFILNQSGKSLSLARYHLALPYNLKKNDN